MNGLLTILAVLLAVLLVLPFAILGAVAFFTFAPLVWAAIGLRRLIYGVRS